MSHHFAPQTTLRAPDGRRKYLTPDERTRFIAQAWTWPDRGVGALCLLLAYTGCRISEALATTPSSLDPGEGCVAFLSLKKRGRVAVRAVPVPAALLERLQACTAIGGGGRLWPMARSTAWQKVRQVMEAAAIPRGLHATPKGLRHGFGIHAVRSGVPLNLTQRWLGHASIATTAIYADALGTEERELAARMWD
ncbi:MAG TPA: site-specific integrase [Devosiaceae bacterium]|jgi:integrase|nr:site-specific integrase [Devosiaceae bacterium]